jgi:hypothetical protein
MLHCISHFHGIQDPAFVLLNSVRDSTQVRRGFMMDLCYKEMVDECVCSTAAVITDNLKCARFLGSRYSKRLCQHVFICGG